MTLAFGHNGSGASLGGTVSASLTSGTATFADVRVTASGTGYTLVATTSGALSAESTAFDVGIAGATYYLSATGSDGNSGTTPDQPWLTPNHALQCGDVVIAAASSAYQHQNFSAGAWGPVACPSGDNVAWLSCETFDACKIVVPDGVHDWGMAVSASYWGVRGWEVTGLGTAGDDLNCFNAIPPDDTANIHHIVFADNVANVCPQAGLGAGNYYPGSASVDYLAFIGNIAYGAGVANTGCASGIGIYQPAAVDTLPGTHIYVAGNLVYGTVNPPGCFDGNGIIFDTFDGHASLPVSYDQQAVVDDNLTLANAGVGVRIEYNDAGPGPDHAPVLVRHNTSWGNSIDGDQYGNPDCGEIQIFDTLDTTVTGNLAVTHQPGCYGDPDTPDAALVAKNVDGTSKVSGNWAYSATGSNELAVTSPGFAFAVDNVVGMDPMLSAAATPPAPSCEGSSSTVACMASVFAGFLPGPAAASYGYEAPTATPTYDPIFPSWLCNVDLPTGLVTEACLTSP